MVTLGSTMTKTIESRVGVSHQAKELSGTNTEKLRINQSPLRTLTIMNGQGAATLEHTRAPKDLQSVGCGRDQDY